MLCNVRGMVGTVGFAVDMSSTLARYNSNVGHVYCGTLHIQISECASPRPALTTRFRP